MVKVNNKQARMMSLPSFWCLYCKVLIYFTSFVVFVFLALNIYLVGGLQMLADISLLHDVNKSCLNSAICVEYIVGSRLPAKNN